MILSRFWDSLEQLIGSSLVGSYNQTIWSQNLTGSSATTKALFRGLLSNRSYSRKGSVLQPSRIYLRYLEAEVISLSLSSLIEQSHSRLLPSLNRFAGVSQALSTGLEEAQSLLTLARLYSSHESGNKIIRRVYPKAQAEGKGVPDYVEAFRELQAVNTQVLEGAVRDPAGSLEKVTKAVLRILPKGGKARVLVENAGKEVMNAFRVSQKGGRLTKASIRDSSGREQVVHKGKGSGLIHVDPIRGGTLVLDFESAESGEILLSEFKLFQLKFRDRATVTEQVVRAPKPIRAIAIAEEKVRVPDGLSSYFETQHEIRLEGQDSWVRVKPRNRDSVRSPLPEVLLLGLRAGRNVPGALELAIDSPVRSFEYRSSFRRTQPIPAHLVSDLAARGRPQFVWEAHGFNWDLSPEQELVPNGLVKDRLRLLVPGQGIVSSDENARRQVGFDAKGGALSITAVEERAMAEGRLEFRRGKDLLSLVPGTPVADEVQVVNRQVVLDGTLTGEAVKVRILPRPLRARGTRAGLSLELSPLSDPASVSLQRLSLSKSITEAIHLERVQDLGGGLYSAKLSHSNLSGTPTPKATRRSGTPGQDVTAAAFLTRKGYVNGREAGSAGDYSLDLVSGSFFFRLGGNYSLEDLHLSIGYSYSEKHLIESWEWAGHDQILVKKTELETQKVSVKKGDTWIPLPVPAGWAVVPSEVKVPGYLQLEEKGLQHAGQVLLKASSNTSTHSIYDLPFWPIDPQSSFTLSKDGVPVTAAGTISGTRQVKVEDPTNQLTHLEMSWDYWDLGVAQASAGFIWIPAREGILLSTPAPRDLEVSYSIHSYQADYAAADELREEHWQLGEDGVIEVKGSAKETAPSGCVLVYQGAQSKAGSGVEGIDSNLVTLFPEYVDLEIVV